MNGLCVIIPFIYIMQSFDFHCFFTIVFLGAEFLKTKFFLCFTRISGISFLMKCNFYIFISIFHVYFSRVRKTHFMVLSSIS